MKYCYIKLKCILYSDINLKSVSYTVFNIKGEPQLKDIQVMNNLCLQTLYTDELWHPSQLIKAALTLTNIWTSNLT
jgi:hypothetical protein